MGRFDDEITIRRDIFYLNHQVCLLIDEYLKEQDHIRKEYFNDQLKILGRKRSELDQNLIQAKKEQKSKE